MTNAAPPPTVARKRRLRWLIVAFIASDLLVLVFLLLYSTEWLAALGSSAEGARLARIERSSHFEHGEFRNLLPTHTLTPGSFWQMLDDQFFGDEVREPVKTVPIVARRKRDYAAPPGSGLRVTWIGHASALIEIEGKRVLADPVWSERVSPSRWLGPKRFHPPPIALADLPAIDAVIISHDHYDHLDMATIRALAAAHDARFLLPLGIGAHVQGWGIDASRIIELDWNERASVAGLTFVATPDRHYSGRGLDRDGTLWASWVILGAQRRVFFSGDSGYFDGFAKTGAEHGPFDLTLIKIGAYGPTWPEIHMTPEEAVQTHLDLRGRVLVPIHWATFNLAMHAWSEPAERALAAARKRDVQIALPRPGEWVDVASPLPDQPWWRDVAR